MKLGIMRFSTLGFSIQDTIEQAWFDSCRACVDYGSKYLIEKGSFAGQQRMQLPFLGGAIRDPHTRPIHVSLRGSSLVTEEVAVNYFMEYLMNPEPRGYEQYTYGSRIHPYISKVVQMLIETPGTNQAVIEVGRPEDILLADPPCLRLIDWKVLDGVLCMSVYFRSWDMYCGFPVNMWGLQLLNEYVSEMTGIKTGPLMYYSAGAHLYDYTWEFF